MTQQKFAFNLLAEFSDDLKAFLSPLLADIKLNVDDNPLADNPTAYRRLVGKLNYLTHTKLEIAFVVHYLSQFMASPRQT